MFSIENNICYIPNGFDYFDIHLVKRTKFFKNFNIHQNLRKNNKRNDISQKMSKNVSQKPYRLL